MHYHGIAIAEVWIGQSPVNVGDVTGSALYGTIWKMLYADCAFKRRGCSKGPREYAFDTHYAFESFFIKKGQTRIKIEDVQFPNKQIGKLLIGIVAGVLEATTLNDASCWKQQTSSLCHVGDIVRVNMPQKDSKKSYLHVRLSGDPDGFAEKGLYRCCETRSLVDTAVDKYKDELTSVYFGFRREVRCIINGWESCQG
ncbi:hypothetical protein IQ07DRAFT_589492 [Pyrenochaeta sp. DS3sAY3a]|nr:hypothetical protein IQ07DRAFT_589492 [Pyrenochaeta sp. DS3sAY3a]